MTEAQERASLRPAPRMSEDDLNEVVRGLIAGRIFCASEISPGRPDLLGLIFLPIGLGGLGNIDPETIGNIIEDISKAGSSSINDYPIFFSCRIVHKDDWGTIVERATRAQKALDEALSGGTSSRRDKVMRRENESDHQRTDPEGAGQRGEEYRR